MEPIPLRTLTVLLNYEMMISDPRFKDVRLLKSTEAKLTFNFKIDPLANTPASVNDRSKAIHYFKVDSESSTSSSPATICAIHPEAPSEMRFLSFEQRELIYHQTHGNNGCFKAIGAFQYFFDLCPPGQKLSIQLENEEPFLTDPASYEAIEFKIKDPKSIIATIVPSRSLVMYAGANVCEPHCVLIFKRSGPDDIIVDATRMQYGAKGRGLFGENYFLGSRVDYNRTMNAICGYLIDESPLP